MNQPIPPTYCMNPTPIQAAGALPLADQLSGMPNQADVIKGTFRPLMIGTIRTKWLDGQSTEVTDTVNVAGSLQPSEPEKLEIAGGSDRSWKYYYLYTDSSLNLDNDDRCIIKGINYRIIGKKDWSESGFIRYRCHEDYSDAKAAN